MPGYDSLCRFSFSASPVVAFPKRGSLQEQVAIIQAMLDADEIPMNELDTAKDVVAKGNDILDASLPLELHEL